jgi:hypothetical protein
MRVWFKSIASKLGLEDSAERGVREILAGAAQRSAIVGFGADEYIVCPDPDCGMIDALEDDTLVIAFAPEMRGVYCIPGETLSIAIATSRGFHRGKVTVLSRWRDSGGAGSRPRAGVRVSIPVELVHIQRRFTHRVPVAFDLAPVAHLSRFDEEQFFLKAPIIDLSESGLRIRIPTELDLAPGTVLKLDARFPSAIPSFATTVEVIRRSTSKVPGTSMLGLRYTESMSELAKAIRTLDVRRGNRPAA